MRVVTQAVVVAALVGLGGGAFYVWKDWQASSAAATPAARAQAPILVEVISARSGTVVEQSESVGTARANESVTITAKQTGNIAIIGFEEGQRVNANHVLIELENKERRADLDQARGDLEQARAARDEIRQSHDRAKQLRSSGNVTEARLDQLESQFRAADGRVRSMEARFRSVDARLDDVRLYAPFAGRVGLRQVSLGALVQPGTTITTLDDTSKIKIDFNVPEIFLGRLRPDLEVAAKSSAYPDKTFIGRVTAIDTRIDPATRSVKVNALFDNPFEQLRPGLFLSVEIVLERREAVLVAEEAVLAEGTKHFVFVVKDNKIERREIKLNQRLPGEVEVASGLKADEVVVARGIQRVRHGQTVNPQPIRPNS